MLNFLQQLQVRLGRNRYKVRKYLKIAFCSKTDYLITLGNLLFKTLRSCLTGVVLLTHKDFFNKYTVFLECKSCFHSCWFISFGPSRKYNIPLIAKLLKIHLLPSTK